MQININSSLFVGQNLITLSEVDSTNNYAKQLLANIKPLTEGTAIVAEHQFAGKGQAGNTWLSNPGQNITTSIVLNPSFLSPDKQFLLSKVASLALLDVLVSLNIKDASIKWPNDIYVANHKIAGILIENILGEHKIKHSIFGIGLNVNQTDFGNLHATSLANQLDKEIDLKSVLNLLFSCLEARYLQLKAGKLKSLDELYLQKLYLFNKPSVFKDTSENEFLGTIFGVSATGQLQVLVKNKLKEFDLKEIAFV